MVGHMQLTKKSIVRNVAKVAAAGASIFAIGWGMLVLQPEPEAPVATAQADIFGFEFAAKSQQQKFLDSLMHEGMEEPRSYDHNGNKMFFSTSITNESPQQALERFQRSFVETGLNERVHMSVPGPPGANFPTVEALEKDKRKWKDTQPFFDGRLAWMDDFVGGVVPVLVSDNEVAMIGTSTKKSANGTFDWAMEVIEKVKANPDQKMDLSEGMSAMRYVNALRESDGRTRITAVWSDEDYQARKFADIGDDLNVNPEYPICSGCKRLLQIDGETESEYGNAAMDAGRQSVDQVLTFYKRALPNRGWQLSETAHVLNAAEQQGIKPHHDAKLLQFSRGSEFMTVAAWPEDGRTGVQLARSN